MIFNLIMSISMDQSLEVFWDSFHSFYILGFKNVKINIFGENNIFGAFLSNWSAGVYELVQATYKNTEHLKLIYGRFFTHL